MLGAEFSSGERRTHGRNEERPETSIMWSQVALTRELAEFSPWPTRKVSPCPQFTEEQVKAREVKGLIQAPREELLLTPSLLPKIPGQGPGLTGSWPPGLLACSLACSQPSCGGNPDAPPDPGTMGTPQESREGAGAGPPCL